MSTLLASCLSSTYKAVLATDMAERAEEGAVSTWPSTELRRESKPEKKDVASSKLANTLFATGVGKRDAAPTTSDELLKSNGGGIV